MGISQFQWLIMVLMHQSFTVSEAVHQVVIPERKRHLQQIIEQLSGDGLNGQEMLERVMNELVKMFAKSRCIFYSCGVDTIAAKIEHESVSVGVSSRILHQQWLLQDNLLFQAAINHKRAIALMDVLAILDLDDNPQLQEQILSAQIRSWLLIPLYFQQELLGILELHCLETAYDWHSEEIALLEAIACQLSVFLAGMQVTRPHSQQLAIERMRSNLINTVGRTFWTPLSTIHACLETLVWEPDISPPYQKLILETSLQDMVRLQEVIQTYLNVELPAQFARVQAENPPQSPHCTDLADMQNCLIAIVGHELRTPLCSIQICLESLLNEPDMSGECRQIMLDTAIQDTERLHKLIQDFFILARLRSGRIYHCLESIDLGDAIALAIERLQLIWPQFLPENIRVQIPQNLPAVRADREALLKVLTKIIDNACKFSSTDGTVEICVRDCGDASTVEIAVIDTGRGIETKKLETIFDCFYQAEAWLRRSINGTGLGLAICRQIIQGMGGQIWAKSAGYNQGSQFYFTLPMQVTPLECEDTCSLAHQWQLLIPEYGLNVGEICNK